MAHEPWAPDLLIYPVAILSSRYSWLARNAMHTLLLLSVLIELAIPALGQTSTTSIEPTPESEIIFHTQAVGADSTGPAASTASHGTCSRDLKINSVCPTCDESTIKYSKFGSYYTFCDSFFTNVTYNEIYFFVQPSVSECISGCASSERCYAPVIGPGGRCLQAIVAANGDPVLATQQGYAALLPRYTGALPPPTPSAPSLTPSSTIDSGSPSPTAKTCDAAEVACPRCNRAIVEDSSGTMYEVYCNNELYSDNRKVMQLQSTAETCMEACSNVIDCGGSVLRPDGKCELARGENVFPQRHAGRIAFLSIDPSFTPESLPATPSAFPTIPFEPSFSPIPPDLNRCNRGNIRCPQCDRLQLENGLDERFCVRCDVQPKCKRILTSVDVKSAHGCAQRCDAQESCQAAIYEQGQCVLCQGSVKSLKPYLLPHEYVVFIADSALDASGSGAGRSSCNGPADSCPAQSRTMITTISTVEVSPSPSS